MNGFLWTLLTRQKTKNYSNKNIKNNIIKNKIERANTELQREFDGIKPQSQTKMFSRRKKTILSYTLSLFYLFVAPVLQVLPVYSAEPAAALSVWDFMVTELVGANCIITDSAVLSAYGSALGSLNAATATAAEIDAAIATAAVNCGVDLSPVFANSAATAAQVGVDAVAATAGENLSATCAGFYAAGEGSAVIPAIAQTCLDVLGVVGIVAGISYISKMVSETVADVAKYNSTLDKLSAMSSVPAPPATGAASGNMVGYELSANGTTVISGRCAAPILYVISSTGHITVYECNCTGSTITSQQYDGRTKQWSKGSTIGAYSKYVFLDGWTSSINWSGGIQVSNVNNYMNSIQSGAQEIPRSQTPSIATSTGYLQYDPSYTPENNPNQEIIAPGFPELKPLPDYANGYGLEPITPPSYQALVDAITQVPGNPAYREDQIANDNSIAEIVQPLISPHIVPLPNPGINPDPQPTGTPDPDPTGSPDPQPTGSPNPKPNTNPFPDPETVPQPTPVVNPTPDSEIAPAPVPYPEPDTPSDQDKTDTDEKITPFDLRDKFPFCIPFDILKIMKLFQGGREAPCFTWEIPLGEASGTVTVDLSPWDSIATLLRTLELILFIMLLAVGTRNLIGGSS